MIGLLRLVPVLSGKELEVLLPFVYNELRRIARRHLQPERLNHTLQTTALVQGAYLRLVADKGLAVEQEC